MTWNDLSREQMEAQLLRQAQTIGKFRAALNQIVDRQFDMDRVPLNQISRRFREVITIAKDALVDEMGGKYEVM